VAASCRLLCKPREHTRAGLQLAQARAGPAHGAQPRGSAALLVPRGNWSGPRLTDVRLQQAALPPRRRSRPVRGGLSGRRSPAAKQACVCSLLRCGASLQHAGTRPQGVSAALHPACLTPCRAACSPCTCRTRRGAMPHLRSPSGCAPACAATPGRRHAPPAAHQQAAPAAAQELRTGSRPPTGALHAAPRTPRLGWQAVKHDGHNGCYLSLRYRPFLDAVGGCCSQTTTTHMHVHFYQMWRISSLLNRSRANCSTKQDCPRTYM